MPARLRFVPLFLLAALGCGLHLHRPRDATTAEGADGELKASRLVDGFVDELAQSRAMAAEEVAAAQAWAEVGRDRDFLDILAARGESDPEIEPLYFPRCRARFKGDGWTTLCSKISTRLHALTGHAFPRTDPVPPLVGGKARAAAPAPAPDPGVDLLRDLRSLQRHWKGPDSGESRLARAVNEHQIAARALRLGGADDPPGCPGFEPPGRSPVLQASVDRQRALCRDRRANLAALAERVVCRGPACGPSELDGVIAQAIAVHDALQQHHDELSRRLYAYESAKRPCSAPESPKGKPVLTPSPAPGTPGAAPDPARPPGEPGLSSEPGKPAPPEPATPAPTNPRPASVAGLSPGLGDMSQGTGSHAPRANEASSPAPGAHAPAAHAAVSVRGAVSAGAGAHAPVSNDMSLATGSSGHALEVMPLGTGANARAPASPVPGAIFAATGARAPVSNDMSRATGSSGHAPSFLSLGTGPSQPPPSPLSGPVGRSVPWTMFAGAGLIGQPWPLLLAPATRAEAAQGGRPADPAAGPTTSAPTSTPDAAPGARVPTTSTPGAAPSSAVTTSSPSVPTSSPGTTPGTTSVPASSPGTPPGTTSTSTTTPGTRVPTSAAGTTSFTPTPDPATPSGVCDEAVLQARFAALAEVPIPAALVAHDLRPLGELGRRFQLAEQLAAVDVLIEARQRQARKRDAADDDPAAGKALAGAPRFARVLHTTIVGIDRLQKTIDTLELAVLALIRETLRVEHDALAEAIGHAERRVRLLRAKLTAQLDEAALLMEAHASLAKLERAGCTAQALMPAYEAGKCRDELTRTLVAFGNAWTLGRAGQKRADAIDLGVRHEASIGRSRAAMALRQVYLAAGVTELVKFTRGGMAPEALAQLIVSTVGFGVLAGAVLAP